MLEHGRLIAQGEVNEVCDYYEKLIEEEYDIQDLPKKLRKKIKQKKQQSQ